MIELDVRNINGTSNRKPKEEFDSWKEFWETHTGRSFFRCANIKCSSKAEVGAHVKKAYAPDNSWYITPLCKCCNGLSSTEVFRVKSVDLVKVSE